MNSEKEGCSSTWHELRVRDISSQSPLQNKHLTETETVRTEQSDQQVHGWAEQTWNEEKQTTTNARGALKFHSHLGDANQDRVHTPFHVVRMATMETTDSNYHGDLEKGNVLYFGRRRIKNQSRHPGNNHGGSSKTKQDTKTKIRQSKTPPQTSRTNPKNRATFRSNYTWRSQSQHRTEASMHPCLSQNYRIRLSVYSGEQVTRIWTYFHRAE